MLKSEDSYLRKSGESYFPFTIDFTLPFLLHCPLPITEITIKICNIQVAILIPSSVKGEAYSREKNCSG
jgi:hypothetical protein